MGLLHNIYRQAEAFRLRRYMKKARRQHGLSTDLKDVIAELRCIHPAYGDYMERTLYPSWKGP